MRAGMLMLGVLAVAAAGRAAAQSDAQEWVRNCERNGSGRGETFCEVRNSRMAAGSSLSVDARDNGGVRVIGTDANEVRIEARVQTHAESEAAARELAGQVRVVTGSGSIRTEGPRGSHDRWWSVSYTVWVPRHLDLTANTTNGPVSAEDVRGRIDLHAVNGPLNLTRVAGDVRGRTSNGPIHVRLTGSRWDGTGLNVETINGPLEISVPDGYSAHLDLSNTNGPMTVEFPVTVNGRIGHHVATDLGSGGPPIHGSTVNGPVVISRS